MLKIYVNIYYKNVNLFPCEKYILSFYLIAHLKSHSGNITCS